MAEWLYGTGGLRGWNLPHVRMCTKAATRESVSSFIDFWVSLPIILPVQTGLDNREGLFELLRVILLKVSTSKYYHIGSKLATHEDTYIEFVIKLIK